LEWFTRIGDSGPLTGDAVLWAFGMVAKLRRVTKHLEIAPPREDRKNGLIMAVFDETWKVG
jgi:hypothetical protein